MAKLSGQPGRKAMSALKRKLGRPATGRDPTISVRIPPEERQAIKAWAAEHTPKMTFSKALRYLAKLGLTAVMQRTRRKAEQDS
jgi:hypothetical protein